jgi:hypothetical protein
MRTAAWLTALLLIGLSAPPARAEERAPSDTVPYLGVATTPVDPMLARHLRLRPGVGLLVQMVDEESAAAGKVEAEDILTELDGQILVNPEQLSTLVRLQKRGQEVALKLRRAGVEQTVKVTLGEREPPPPAEAPDWSDPRFDLFRFNHMRPDLWPRRDPPPAGRLKLKPETDQSEVEMRTTAVVEENGHRAELTDDGKTRRFKVTNDDGKVIFEGEVKGDDDVAKMPKVVRELYDELTSRTKIKIRPRLEDQPERGDPAGRVST